jgi:cupin fold WbuC family metalloprotein
MHIRQCSPEVYVAEGPLVKVSRGDIEFLKKQLGNAPRGRVRLCAHSNAEDPLHEMMIALSRWTYIRPHKHRGKSESFHVIEGRLEVVIFDEGGELRDVIELGESSSGRNFFYRMAEPEFHSLILRTDPVVIHETTNGPFQAGDAIFAPWAPEEGGAGVDYLRRLEDRVNEFLSSRTTNERA